MIVKLYTESKDGEPIWIDFDVDMHSVQGYWNIPECIIEGIIIPSEEFNIVLNGIIMTIKECADLINILKYKFEL